jgi:hypothetical protein
VSVADRDRLVVGRPLGIEDQLSLNELSDDLRGERLRAVATDVLWRNFHAGDVLHYKSAEAEADPPPDGTAGK